MTAGTFVIAISVLVGQPATADSLAADTAAPVPVTLQFATEEDPSSAGGGALATGLALAVGVGGLAALGWLAVRRRWRIEAGRGEDSGHIPLIVPQGLAARGDLAGRPALTPVPVAKPSESGPGQGLPLSHGSLADAPPEPDGSPEPDSQPAADASDSPRPDELATPPQLPVAPAAAPSVAVRMPARGRRGAAGGTVAAAMQAEAEEEQAGPVYYHPPPEGTLQVLPGRLEVVSGTGRTAEVRFIRLPGREPVITFGRSEGEPHAHVRLESPTVSRTHAAMQFAANRWHIENRSRTNPVVVNGTPLPLIGGAPIPLRDGDIIEMGAVNFRFRER